MQVSLGKSKSYLENVKMPQSKKELESDLNNFFNKNNDMRNALLAPLYRRLKYATGRLEKSFKFEATVSRKKGGETTVIELDFILTEPSLLPALTGEQDNVPQKDIPSVAELVSYIRAKQKFFAGGIRNLQEYRMEMLRRRTQHVRTMLNFKGNLAGYDTSNNAIIELMATTIRSRMFRRLMRHGSAVKGSEYVLAGIYKNSIPKKVDKSVDGFHEIATQFVRPRYKKMTPALLTMNSGLGVFNKMASGVMQSYIDSLFSQIKETITTSKGSLGTHTDKKTGVVTDIPYETTTISKEAIPNMAKTIARFARNVQTFLSSETIKKLDDSLKHLVIFENAFNGKHASDKQQKALQFLDSVRNNQYQHMMGKSNFQKMFNEKEKMNTIERVMNGYIRLSKQSQYSNLGAKRRAGRIKRK